MTGNPTNIGRPERGTTGSEAVELSEREAAAVRADLNAIARTARTHLTDEFTVGTTLVRTAHGPKGQVTVGFPTGDTLAAEVDLGDISFEDGPDGPIPADEIHEVGTDLVASILLQWRRIAEPMSGDAPAAR